MNNKTLSVNFLSEISNFIFTDKYARYNELMNRRETWDECIDRVEKMHLDKFKKALPKDDLKEISRAFNFVREKRVVPSMRALEDSTPINTKTGWKLAGEIQKGDTLYNSKGKETTVKGVVKFKDKELFELTFSDNTTLAACSEHLWIISTIDDKLCTPVKKRVVDTLYIKDHLKRKSGYSGITIWNSEPIEYTEKSLMVDPYILGLWLGDGCSPGYSIACSIDESQFITEQYAKAGYSSKHSESTNIWTWHVHGLAKDLRKYNLLNNKHIPAEYLRGSTQQRLALVQGLMDTDGHITKTGHCRFTNANMQIVESFKEILSSLGIKYTEVLSKPRAVHHQICSTVCFWTTLPVFRMPRKLKFIRPNNSQRTQHRTVKKIEYIGKGDATCFHVDSKDHSFLAGKQMIVTHNSMQFGGKAVLAHHPRIFNCAVRHIDSPRAFAEVFYLLLCGCGVGLGLSKRLVDRLPDLVGPEDKSGTIVTYVVEDSIEGWADSIEALLNCYFRNTAYSGRKIVFDYSRIRPEGAEIKTGGGKAPGYKGLKRGLAKIKHLLDHIIEEGGQVRLKPINAYDILMHCADAVLSGGIRRSATAVIFDKSDTEMMNAKVMFNVTKYAHFTKNDKGKYEGIVYVDGQYGGSRNHQYEVTVEEWEYNQIKEKKIISWLHIEPQRARSNNSVLLLRNEITEDEFIKINSLTRQFGEPGFVFAEHSDQLFNPCFEIGFLPITDDGICGVQFCNLTSINGAKINNAQDFFDTVWAATVIGTLQATYTDFKYLNTTAKKLTEEEALLGVSITGTMDSPDIILNPQIQKEGAAIAKKTNEEWAAKLGIRQAARITTLKPEGTSSLVLESASGIHPHHARRYFRRVQVNKQDPVYKFFKKHNPHMCEESVWSANKTDDVITFPITVPAKAIIKADLTALEHLNIIKNTQINWVMQGNTKNNTKPVTHNVSCTVKVGEDEWTDVFNYLFTNRHFFGAVALLPDTGDKLYKQAPNEAITTEKDEELWQNILSNYTPVDYKQLEEDEDTTKLSANLACAGGRCDIILPDS
jgi:ribonucleoside-diphosphate reductase alpha chain